MPTKNSSKSPKKLKFKELKVKVYEFLNAENGADNLTEIINLLKVSFQF
jgi:hypothetical protein